MPATGDKMLVDAMTVRMTLKPQSLDTIHATNLHADFLSDLAIALAGSLGVAPTGNIDPQRRFPSTFKPIHGSALDITSKGIANPVATAEAVRTIARPPGSRLRHRHHSSHRASVRQGRIRHQW